MTFIIPSGLISTYNEGIDAIIEWGGVNVQLVFPPKQVECPNCVFNSITGRSSGQYKSGGPYLFTTGDICPYCNGEGLRFDEQTQTIKMLVYWEPKDFVKVDSAFRQISIDQTLLIPNSVIQTKCHFQHLPKVEQCIEIRVHAAINPFGTWTYERFKESVPHGFKSNNYILTYWKRK